MSRSAIWRTRAASGAISGRPCAGYGASMRRAWRSSGRSSARRHSATPRALEGPGILADIETAAANPEAAAAARTQARAAYLAYRRDGGENHDSAGRIALAVTEH